MGKKIGRFLVKFLVGIIVLLILLLLLLRLPYIQTKIAHIAANRLSKQLETKVAIDKVAMNFVDNATVKGIYVEDKKQDTLLYSNEISVDIGFFKLLRKIIEIDQLTMHTGVINIHENPDSLYNFQFIVDAFASEDTTTVASETTFTIDLDRIEVIDIRARADLLGGKHKVQFDDLLLKIDTFDLERKNLVFEKIDINGFLAESITYPPNDSVSSTNVNIDLDQKEVEITFPLAEFPYNIEVKRIDINEANVSLKEDGYVPADTFDTRYIELSDLHIKLKDLSINEELLEGLIQEVSLNLNDQLMIEEFSTGISFSDRETILSDLSLETLGSKAKASAKLSYSSFADLTNLRDNVKIELDIPSVALSMNNLSYFVPTEALEPFKNEMLRMNGRAKGSISNILLDKLHLEVGNTLLDAKGRLLNLTDPDLMRLRNFSIKAKADYEEYVVFLPNDTLKRQLLEIGDIKFSALLGGGADSLNVKNLEITTESLARAKLSGNLRNLSDTEKLRYNLVIHNITSGYADAAIFVDSLPEIATKFDTISYSGNARGTIYDVILDGGFDTSLGNISTDIKVNFNKEYDNASYYGKLALEEFDLRTLLENDSLNTITMDFELDGSGLDLESIKTKLEGTVQSVDYNNYTYKNLNIDGLLDGKMFSGAANIDDSNIKLDFKGSVDMNDSIPAMNFDLVLDTLNLNKLNLADEMFQIKLAIDADITGLNADDADGDVIVSNISLSKEDKVWQTDSIVLTATNQDGEKALSLQADFLDLRVEGDYQLSVLPDVILDFFDQYFPLKTFLGRTIEEDEILSPAEKQKVRSDALDAKLLVYDATEVAQFFDFPLTRLDTVTVDFALDFPNKMTNFGLKMPTVIYDGYFVEGTTMTAENDAETITANLKIDSVSLSEAIHLSEVKMDMLFKDQSATLTGLVRNQKNEESLGFSTTIMSENANQFSVDMAREFILNNQQWDLNQTSSILAGSEGLLIPEININNGREAFNVSGSQDKIDLSFTDFNLNNLIEIVGIDSLDISGLMNGALELGLNDETPINGDLLINDIRFNEFQIGDLDLEATKEGQDVAAVLSLKGEEVLLDGDINYDLSSSYMFGKVLVEKLNLAPFEPFLTTYVQDLSGAMQGYLAIEGQVEDPLVTGALYFQEVEAFINDLGTVYKIKDGRINVTDGLVKPTATLEDQAGRLSYLTGDINHKLLSDITFDLHFEAEEFMFLNSKQNKREYFYGSFVGKVIADITGTSELPIITAKIEALKGTNFTVQLLSSEAILTKENYMIFYDGSEIDSEHAIDSISRKVYEPNNSVALNLTLTTSDAALFHVIVDPVTGDKLDVRGNSVLSVTIPSNGDIRLVGDYVVSEGSYRVSYENTIRRTFALDANSKIAFDGDPTGAKLDMRALYTTEVNTKALLDKYDNGLSDTEGVSSRSEVSVVLNVGGTLAQPNLSFDIRATESSTDPVGNALSNALAQLRQDETQVLEQVGSLILFNSFTGASSGGNINSAGNAGASTAISSVGNLINGQLNKLASSAQGLEIDFNMNQYKDYSEDGNTNVTAFGLGLKQKLFNDRLIISAGGNANLETGQASSNDFSSFAGDFVIQYVLTKNGKLRVKVFQKSDYNALDNANVWQTGAGLTYKTKFGQIMPKE